MPSNGVEDAVAVDAHLKRAEHINGDRLRGMRLVRLNSVVAVTMPGECKPVADRCVTGRKQVLANCREIYGDI
ncbi:hypothetical protein ATY30_02450 [Sinorhizobium americanum]|nr:hypothetical protein ATY30_02450 [Sinorhizobium americanum]